MSGPVGLAARRLAIIDLARGDQPMHSEDGRCRRPERRALRAPPAAGRAGAARAPLHVALRHGGAAAPLRGARRRLRRRAARHVRDRAVGRRARRLAPGPRSVRDQAAVLPRRGRRPVVRVGAQGARAPAGVRGRGRPRGARGVPRVQQRPGARCRSTATCASCPPGTCSWRSDGRVEVRRFARPAPVAAGDVRREGGRALADELRDAAARLGPRAPRVRRAGRRLPVRRHRLVAARRARRAGEPGRGADVLDRLRGAVVRRARAGARWWRRATAPTTTSSCCAPTPRALLPEIAAAFDEPFADSSALPTYAVSRLASEHVKVALSGEGGDELFGGYFTYVADVLAARSRVARAAALARPVVERLPSSSRRVSLEYRAKRFVRAAARPPLERHHGWKEIFSAEARAALLEPGRRAPASTRCGVAGPLRRDGRRRAARAPAGRRHRHVPRRRPAREDRPREHGPLARGARAVPRPGRRRARVRAADVAEGARRSRRSGCSAGAARRPGAARDRARPEARLLDPGRGVAARRAARRSPATCCRPTRCAGTASSARPR